MALSGGSGGASTNLAGLSPEQINAISGTDIANSKLGLEQVQNIFENATKMAYADYLDANRKAAKFRTPLVGEKTYWDYDQNTGQWVDTGIPVPERLAEHRPSSAFPYWFGPIQTPEGLSTGVGHRGTGTFGPARTPTGEPAPPLADPARKQEAQDTKLAQAVADKVALIQGKVFDKKGKPIPATRADIEFVNKYTTGPTYYFEQVTPTQKGIGSFKWAGEPEKKIITIPKEAVLQKLKELQVNDPTITLEDILYSIQKDLAGEK